MFSGPLFILTRVLQLLTLVPILGMLAWFVHIYVRADALTPTTILVLFTVSVLASAWCLATLLLYFSARHSANVVALFDLAFVGALIAGVYLLRGPGTTDCSHVRFYVVDGDAGVAYSGDRSCSMLKACFVLGIIDVILFAWSALMALFIFRRHGERVVERRTYHTERHSRRRSSPGRSYAYSHSHRSGGSRHGSRSSRTRRSVYV